MYQYHIHISQRRIFLVLSFFKSHVIYITMSNHCASQNDSIWGDLSAAFSKSTVSSQQVVEEDEQPIVQRIGTPRPKVNPTRKPEEGKDADAIKKINLNMDEEDI